MMIKKQVVVDKVEFEIKDDGRVQPVAYKGRVVKVIEIPRRFGSDSEFGLFNGNIKEDRLFWKKNYPISIVKYFLLKELKGD